MPTPYRGVFSLANLKKREVKKLEIPASLYQQFIGGSSIATVLFSEYIHSKPDPREGLLLLNNTQERYMRCLSEH